MNDVEQRGIAVIRGLAMDAPHAARSGHQGTAMALAPLAHVLFTRIMTYDAADPAWPDRDRFVLSAGHASILQYSMLYLTGQGLTLDDLRDFRQWDSATPGHPEVGHTAGVETTTGPLGQGLGNAVGMAIAERWLRARFGADLFDHRIFAIVSDGDLSEGVSHEAASLAGHQRLGRLVAVYDDNHITIDGRTDLALSDNAAKRFEAYGWHVEALGESGENLDTIEAALRRAMAVDDAPSLIVLRTHVAYPSPTHTDDPAAHGYALFDDEIAQAKGVLGLPSDEQFYAPGEVVDWYRDAGRRGAAAHQAWRGRLDRWQGDRTALEAALAGKGVDGWADDLPAWSPGESVATRAASGACLNAMLDRVPGVIAGGADLTGNTGTKLAAAARLSHREPGGQQLFYGIREHGMGAAMVGMAHHGGVLPVGGTFLVFSDYMRPSVRLAALSGARVVFAWSHDSVGVGEDGPTHQPIEHVMALRAIPGLRVIRPADANEVAVAWRASVDHDGPTALILTRQGVPVLDGTAGNDGLLRGAYSLVDTADPDLVLVGTGSEVAVCVDAASELERAGHAIRVVSMPCWELFASQDADYQTSVLAPGAPKLSVEAGITAGWSEWVDASVGIDRYGASAPGAMVMEKLGITVENVVANARSLLEGEHA